MNMTNIWKKMMLNLKVESTQKKIRKSAFCRKISCGGYLMYCPLTINFAL